MLALKECLIREGVLNLDSPEKYRPYHLHGSRSSGTMDIPRYRKTIAASSDLSTAPATAKTSCQPPEPQKPKQPRDSEDSSSQKSSAPLPQSYRGQHPHFHHHTTPAYYTDLQLRIHTPNASDVGALNENYRSVYSTPSTQLVEQRSFPKSSTATKDPPLPISNPARGTFFRGDSASSDSHSRLRRSQLRTGSEPGRFYRYSQGSASPTKGETSGGEPPLVVSHSPNITSTNSTTTTSNISSCNPVEQASPPTPPPSSVANPSGSGSGRTSRHKQRFHSRSRRAVRVRSESRPISALYDIICKEKNLDNSSSSSSSNEQEKGQDRDQLKTSTTDQEKPTADKLATFWPLHHHYLNPPMSSGNSGGTGSNPKQQQPEKQHHQQLLVQGATKDLPAGCSSSSDDDEVSLRALHSTRKVTNLPSAKATSLPPEEGNPEEIALSRTSSNRLSLRLARSLEPSVRNIPTSASQEVQNYDAGEPVNTERLFVEPPNIPLSAIRNTLYDHDLEIEDCDSTTQLDQGDVRDTLERWSQELSSGTQLMNGANGHHQSDPEADHHDHDHQPDHLEHDQQHAHQSLPVEPKSHHHNQHHQATNARRFITRTTRSASRQSSAGHSPPPPLHRSDDSSSSSPSPTRRRNKPGGAPTPATAATDPPSSSANGNSSAYETAATTVMTHDQQQRHPPVEVPKALAIESQQPEAIVLGACPTASASLASQSRGKAGKCSINCTYSHSSNNNCNARQRNANNGSSSNNSTCNNNTKQLHATPMPPLANANKAPLIVLKTATSAAAAATAATSIAAATSTGTAATSAAGSPIKRRKNPLSPLRLGSQCQSTIAPPQAIASPLLSGGSCSSSTTSPQSSPAVRTTKASRLRAAALDKKKEEEQRQRYSSPVSPRIPSSNGGAATHRRLSSSELSPKSPGASGFNSEPVPSASSGKIPARSASQPEDTPPTQRRQPLVAVGSGISMKQSLSELHFTGGAISPPKATAECTLRMRPRTSTMSTENTENGRRDHLANLQLSPVEKHKRTPEVSPRRLGDRDKSAKRKSNLNRSLTEEATKDGDEVASSTRRRRRRELGMARPLVPGGDEALRDLLQTPQKSSCSESTNSISEPYRQFIPAVRHPEVPVRTMTAVLPAPRPLHAPVARSVTQKFNERTKTDLAEIKKIAEQSEVQQQQPSVDESQKMSAIMRRKSTDEGGAAAGGLLNQNSPPAPNQIVSILKKKEHGMGDCNSSASSNPSPVTFSSSVMDNPLAGAARCKRQGILKKRSSLDESRYYSRSHSPDERSILIKSARRNSLEEAGTGLSPAQAHGILKQSSYDSSKSDGCPSATESQPHSILKKKDSLSTPSDGGCHKHVSISQAVILAAAELAAHDGITFEDGEEHEIRPILKQESTSSEEAVRPPKPILKKKSFGEADEHEIRPILKSSRKSSREEFDLSGLESEVNDSLSSILKTDSPSKRRSLGSASHDLEESNTSPSLLKRRTRSLERRDVQPGMDLAAALDAIATSQVAPSTPVDFVTTPASISVAERIKRMEMLSTPTSREAGGANSSWESPLQASSSEPGGPATPRVLKPSVLRRDLQRERYKTQPVTNEEKSFFKANSAPFDISATSAFKPTKPLDIRLTHAPHPPLISPITGQPLSHVPAPLLLSSSTNSGAGTSFRLARSSTQPLQSPRVVHLASQAASTGGSSQSPQTSLLARQHSVNDSSVNLSEQLTLSIGTDSEHIFEMSALEEDSAIQSLSDETAASANSASANSTSTATNSTTTTTPPSGLTRSNSVRARANMFQQLQEQSRNQRATGGSRQSPPASAEVSSTAADNSMQSDELSTPNATIDAEFEPSSLSLAERLAFFSNLCESGGGGGGSANGRYRSRTSSYSRSPPIDRTTPRSSTTASSASVTPTPMDYSPIPHEKEPSSLTLESIIEPEQEEMREQVDQQQEEAKLRKNEPPVLRESPLHNGFHVLTRSATDPPSSTSPLRLNVRTIGKLILPDTFRGDRNNNNNSSSNKSGSTSWNSCMVKLQSLDPVNLTVQLRTIGKVKSPFIEKQQEKVNPEKLSNGTSDSGSDSGKENCASNQQENQQPQQQLQQDEDRAPPRVSEMRRKITRLVQQQQPQPQPVNRRHTTEITTVTIRSPNVDDRFAKYFGVKESFNSTTTLLKTQSLAPTTNQVEATNSHVRLPITTVVSKRRELLKRTRPLSMDHYSSGCTSPTAMPSPKRAHSPINRRKATISSIEDIEVTPDELRAAGKDFKLLYGELLG
nr:serine/arginine repetitive matrix protein 2 isoform X17 [Drosophila suzukii]